MKKQLDIPPVQLLVTLDLLSVAVNLPVLAVLFRCSQTRLVLGD